MQSKAKLKIAFYAASCIPVHAKLLEERPLGGTETGLIKLAEELALRGHAITVFTSHQNPPAPISPTDPLYLPAKQLFNQGEFDLFVAVQDWRPLVQTLPAKRLFFWTGDGAEQFSNFGIGDKRVSARIEKFLAVSNFHAESIAKSAGFPKDKISIIGNGVNLDLFSGTETRSSLRMIYSSAPYRGLAYAVQILPALVARIPKLDFQIFSGMQLYDREKPFVGPHLEQARRIQSALSKFPQVTWHDPILQSQLAREYMKSSLFFYPCTVPETCCMTALEAQAAGCALLTSAAGALPETVGTTGIVIEAQAGTNTFIEGFVSGAVKILTDQKLQESYRTQALTKAASSLSWKNVADKFETLL